tara:strand:- start:369 stop:2204 length:1836 start_codon:yes stop_codon:yes gene_type:complete
MIDKDDRLLYIGKSKNIRNRVRSYFSKTSDISARIALMVRQIYTIEIIVTDNESEALTLESNLIKNYQPYFNILLKDDKKYPYICITWSEDYPRIFITRRRRERKKNDKFYGPFVDVKLIRETLFLIKKVFPLRQRPIPLYKDRTCLNYSIDRCPGVCQEKISSEDYHKILKRVEMIFQGRTEELHNLLKLHMIQLSDNLKYEEASKIRDQLKGLRLLSESQKMTIPDSSICRDTIAIASDNKIASIQIFQMRAGKLVGRLGYISKKENFEDNFLLQRIIEEHYSKVDVIEIPSELLVQYDIPNIKIISEWLSELKGSKVTISKPIRAKKAELIDLVHTNAKYELQRVNRGIEKKLLELEDLSDLIDLKDIPNRIEGYDISHIQGSDAVASQVVFIQGLPAKQHYRKYKIKNPIIESGHSDDFLCMSEIIKRRFKRWSRIKSELGSLDNIKSAGNSILDSGNISDWPDLIMIDGGKGQLSAVMHTLKELKLESDVNVISLAKRNEEIFLPGSKRPLETDKEQPALLLLRRLRDEAHRFAIEYHRKKRKQRMRRSHLTEIAGIGPKRIKLLLSHFNSIEAIQIATYDQLSKTPGVGKLAAKNVWNYFHQNSN